MPRTLEFWVFDEECRSAVGYFVANLHGRKWPDVQVAMLACFDASGHESDQPYLVVAGFVSSARDWDDFSVKWLTRLRDDDLPYFHASEFATSSGIFKGWREQEPRRQALCRDLIEIVIGHVFRLFVQGVKPKELSTFFTKEQRAQFNINAYALCGRTCVADLARSGLISDIAPELVFESGDLGKGKLTELLLTHGYPEPSFRPGKKPQQTPLGRVEPFVPLQAADWLAYESFRLLKKDSADRDTWRWPMRQFFQRLPGVLGFWDKTGLERVKVDLDALDSGNAAPIVLANRDDVTSLGFSQS